MQRKILMGGLVALLACGIAGIVHADAGAPKIGYVDLQKALNDVDEGRQAKSQLEKEVSAKQSELEAAQKSLEAMKQQLEKDQKILTPEAMQKKEEEYRNKFLELTQKMNSYKMDMTQKEAQSTGSILNALRQVVHTIGGAENYSLILETSQDVVLFSPNNADLTERVIKAYNQLPKSQKRISSK